MYDDQNHKILLCFQKKIVKEKKLSYQQFLSE